MGFSTKVGGDLERRYGRLICVILQNSVAFGAYYAGLWPRSQRLGLEAASRRPDASPRSRLGLGLRRLGLVG